MRTDRNEATNLGMVGMIIGIIALLLSCVLIGGLIGVVGLALSIVGIAGQDSKKAAAIIGTVLNGLSLLIAFIIVIAVIGSSSSTETATVDNSTEIVDITQEEFPKNTEKETEIEEPVASTNILGYEIHTSDVTTGNGNVIGTYAYIEVPKSDLTTFSQNDFITLCDCVSSFNYNWFTIKCDDGTGIVFMGCDTLSPIYGKIDNDFMLDEAIGFIKKENDTSYSYSQQISEMIEEEQSTSIVEEQSSISSSVPIEENTQEIAVPTEENAQITPAPTPAPAETVQESSAVQTDSPMVWISSKGTKYHSNPNCSNMKNPYQITIQDAKNMGREPCKKCY